MHSEYLKLEVYKKLYSSNPKTFLEKRDIIRNFPHNFMNEKLKKAISFDEVEYTTTSGTTSDRMQIIRKKGWWMDEYKRTYKNHPLLKKCIDLSLPKAIFTTAICSNMVCYLNTPSYEERIINGTLYLNFKHNPWSWTKDDIENIIDEIKRFNVYYLDVDPVYFGIFLLKKDEYKISKEIPMPQIITISYEYSPLNLLNYIKTKLPCPILNLYGNTECGYIFIGDDNGHMKLCPDMIDVDFIKLEGSSNLYELVISSYKNEYMPFIRYRLGDVVEMTKQQYIDFRKKSTVSKIIGRKKSILKNNNKLITVSDIDGILTHFPDIILYQLIAIKNSAYIFKYISHKKFLNKRISDRLKERLEKLLDAEVQIKDVETITPELSGKFSLIKPL